MNYHHHHHFYPKTAQKLSLFSPHFTFPPQALPLLFILPLDQLEIINITKKPKDCLVFSISLSLPFCFRINGCHLFADSCSPSETFSTASVIPPNELSTDTAMFLFASAAFDSSNLPEAAAAAAALHQTFALNPLSISAKWQCQCRLSQTLELRGWKRRGRWDRKKFWWRPHFASRFPFPRLNSASADRPSCPSANKHVKL